MRSEAPPEANAGVAPAADLPRLWHAAQERFADRPSFVFLRHLRPQRLDGDTLLVAIAPGQREVAHIATPARLEQVAQALSELRGRRTRIELQPPAPDAPPAGVPDAQPDAPARDGGKEGGQLDRRAALQLPLVRVALQAFPDAMLIDAREEGTPDPTNPDVPPPASPAAGTPPDTEDEDDV